MGLTRNVQIKVLNLQKWVNFFKRKYFFILSWTKQVGLVYFKNWKLQKSSSSTTYELYWWSTYVWSTWEIRRLFMNNLQMLFISQSFLILMLIFESFFKALQIDSKFSTIYPDYPSNLSVYVFLKISSFVSILNKIRFMIQLLRKVR